jgi:hypothetical protein
MVIEMIIKNNLLLCKECRKEFMKLYKELNSESLSIKKKEYNIKNKEVISLKNKEYNIKNKERKKERILFKK